MKDRLKQIIDYYNLNTRNFEIKISVSEGVISKFLANKNGIKADTLQKINAIFPNINLDWLITGRGNMLIDLHHEPKKNEQTPDIEKAIADERERTIQVLQDTNANLLAEIQQLRNYVNITSNKYIQIVEQTLAAAQETNANVKIFQSQVGFAHPASPSISPAAKTDDKTH